MESPKKIRREWIFAGLLGLVVLGMVVVQLGGLHGLSRLPSWLGAGIHRKIFPEQNAERSTYEETVKGPVALATMVSQLHIAWPGESVAVVHGAAFEVAAHLLHHSDIEVGDLENGKFVPWPVKPWAAEEKIRAELMAQPGFFANERHIVFRRATAPTP